MPQGPPTRFALDHVTVVDVRTGAATRDRMVEPRELPRAKSDSRSGCRLVVLPGAL